jgi:heme/copper-type cytochrome/quinol oxidase subunit 1
MGVVFGLFAGCYHWIKKISGNAADEEWGQGHFWITFLGVNLTFFPMHFLGLAGMPRRIPDYPDMYSFWNFICTIGSNITFIGTLLFVRLAFRTVKGRYAEYMRVNMYTFREMKDCSKQHIFLRKIGDLWNY